ncbi:hypothetical protein ABQF34_07235 [Mycolicibacterium boenickei]
MQAVIGKAVDRVANGMNSIPMPSFGTGVNPAGMAAMVGAVVTVTPLITGLLGSVMAALTTLPGLIAAVAVPIGALALGMDGLKAAAARLQGPFEDLKKSISGAVETQFGPVFDQLGRVFPMLTAALPKVTQGMADVAKAFVDTITSATGLQRIEESISNIGTAISRSAPGIASFTDGLLTLATKFTEKLPGIADWFNGVGKSFSDWVTKFTTVGPDGTSAFDRAMQGLGDTLKTITGALVDVGGKFLDAFSDPEKMKSFRTELEAVASALSSIATAMVTVTGVFSKLGSIGGQQGWLDLMPVQIQFIADKIGQLPALLSGAWNGLSTAASAAWAGVTSVVQTAVSTITGIVSGIGATLSGIWNGVASAASAAWGAVTSTVQTAIATVVSTVVSAGGQVLAEVSSWPGRIVAAIGDLAGQLAAAARSAAEAFVSSLASGLLAGIGRVAAAASSLMGAIAKFIPHSPAVAGPFAGAGWQKVTGFGDTIGNQLVLGLQAQESKVAAAMTGVMNAAQGAMLDFSTPVNMAADFGRANLDQALSDLGIGGGALSGALKWGLDYGQQMLSQMAGQAGQPNITYNVSNVDETIALERNRQSKLALQYHRA